MQDSACLATARKVAPCQRACPAGIDVPRYIRAIASGSFEESLAIIRESIPFPFVCGYACFAPCESKCSKGQFDSPVAIRALKRAAAERGGESWKQRVRKEPPSGKRVAVVGSGPSGLTAAYYLALKGHDLTVFERQSEPGGMMRWAIPEYRLPASVLSAEIDEIVSVGVTIKTGTSVKSVKDLRDQGFDAIYVACGAQKSMDMSIPCADAEGVVGALSFLGKLSSGGLPSVGRRVAVIGGGNAAIDAARCAVRLGAEEVKLFYRRGRKEMPAYPEEITMAEEEGVRMHLLSAPASIEKTTGGLKVLFDCIELEAPDKSGRARPVCKEGFTYSEVFDNVIMAVGQEVVLGDDFGLSRNGSGAVEVDPGTLATEEDGVFAGGDVIERPDSIIKAIADGRLAASSIDKYLGGSGDISQSLARDDGNKVDLGFYTRTSEPRTDIPCTALGLRVNNFQVVEKTLSSYLARRESDRCLWCDYREFSVELDFEACKECGYCMEVCEMGVFERGEKFNKKGYRAFVASNPQNCVGCMKCFFNCPDFCIEIKGVDKK